MTKIKTPRLGMIVDVRGVICRIAAIRPAGTIDVIEAVDGSNRAWRISGLSFRSKTYEKTKT